jgi:hypothetical protein
MVWYGVVRSERNEGKVVEEWIIVEWKGARKGVRKLEGSRR